MKNEKKSILKEALTDYNEIMEAADANAKKKLAEEFPEKFKSILKEELNKNKSAKESYKKIDGDKESDVVDKTEEKNESVMKKDVKETVKVERTVKNGKPFEDKPKAKTANMNEEEIDAVENEEELNEEREKEFVKKKHESDEPNFAKGTEEEKGKKFTKKVNASSGTPMANKLKENYDMTELDADMVDDTIDAAGEEDEFLTMEDIEAEIANMENLGEELDVMEEGNENDPFEELVKMRNQLDEMIGKLGGVREQKNNGGLGANKVNPGGPTTSMIDEFDVQEQKNNGGLGANKVNPGGPTTSMIDEVGEQITDADIEEILNQKFGSEDDSEIEESMEHTQTHDIARKAGAHNHTNYGKGERLRYAMKEGEEKKVQSLISENKKLMKKLNETKKYKESVTTLVENYKSALEKYRGQLKEMAVFNTNLAHVNNLLVNEELALTQEDKIKIINEFKNVNTITESQNKYMSFINEMKENKKTITESMKNKMGASIQPSSKQKLDEVVEKTAYENNEHLTRMKKIIETIERSDKKKII